MNNIINLLSLLLLISELMLLLLKRSKKGEVKIKQDKLSLAILWIVILCAVFTGIVLAYRYPMAEKIPALLWGGIVVFIAGMVIRWVAIYQLGKAFTVDVSVSSTQKIKDNGLYRTIRHPSYLGLVLVFLGLSFMFNSWYSPPVIFIPFFLALIYRIRVEEHLLSSSFGEAYDSYKKRTKRIIPYIW